MAGNQLTLFDKAPTYPRLYLSVAVGKFMRVDPHISDIGRAIIVNVQSDVRVHRYSVSYLVRACNCDMTLVSINQQQMDALQLQKGGKYRLRCAYDGYQRSLTVERLR